MKSDSDETTDNNYKTNDTVVETESESRITLSESPEKVFLDDPAGPSSKGQRKSSLKRQNSSKSIRGLNKNRIFPQKLPPIRKSKIMKRINKVKQEHGISLPLDGFEVKWDKLSYIVEKSSFGPNFCKTSMPSYRVILKCLSGSFASSELTAVMGPSGAGKSTLLACVCGKRKTGVSGDITIRGCNRIKVSIITQNDYLTDKFTLREALLFASKAKNGKNKDHDEMINNVVNSLSLESCLETRLGKCSGGQRRKISIALELVSNPNILILDEPTSGLDSSSCYQIVENLRELTQHKKNPMAIVATIHQPSARVFSLFHNIYVISHNGQAIYHGSPDKLVEQLAQVNISVPLFHNPADFIAEIASGEHGGEAITKLATKRKESSKSLQVADDPKATSSKKLSQMSQTNKYSNFYHLVILVQRHFRILLREPHLSWIRLTTSLIVGTLMGLLFGHDLGQVGGCPPRMETLYSSKPTDLYKNFEYEHKAITENLGSLYFNVIYLLYSGIMPMIMVFPMEFNVVLKQYTNGWYSTLTYYLSKVITDLPITFMATSIYLVIWYVLSSQIWEFWRLALTLALGMQVMLIGQSIGLICSAIFSTNPVSAGYLGITTSTPFLLMAGFFVRSKRIPFYLRPLTAFSYTKYAFESTVIALYGYDRCWYPETNQTFSPPPWLKFLKVMTATMIEHNDNDDDLDTYDDPQGKEDQAMNDILALFSGTTVSINSNEGKYQSLVMSEFEFNDDMLPYNCLILGVYAVVLQMIAYSVFVWKLKKAH